VRHFAPAAARIATFGSYRALSQNQHRSTVVGSTRIRGNTSIRNKIPSSVEPGESIEMAEFGVVSSAASPLKPDRKPRCSGAMAQQSSDSDWGNQSAPQKLLHLVGCREPKRAGPVKR
jgi:hypothetical protein